MITFNNNDALKKKLSKFSFKYGVSPSRIANNLLSDDDKKDVLIDKIKNDVLDLFIKIWVNQGMKNVANRLPGD